MPGRPDTGKFSDHCSRRDADPEKAELVFALMREMSVMELTEQQVKRRYEFREFTDVDVAPNAGEWDEQEALPSSLFTRLARRGYLGAVLPERWGGRGLDMVEFGFLNEELGKACSSVRTLLTVHSMVASTLLRWGSEEQKSAWLRLLAEGRSIGAFALTEPGAGSDVQGIETEAVSSGDAYFITGRKDWISFGEIADLFLVFARTSRGPTAFLLEKSTNGLTVAPTRGLLGVRASMTASLNLEQCCVPEGNVVGIPGGGLSIIASSALDLGRYSVAWGCVGIAEGCLQSCLFHAGCRKQFGKYLREHELVQRMIARMVVNTKSARLLCYQAGRLRDAGDPRMIAETCVAKYAASRAAFQTAKDAVQIHGANGCRRQNKVERLFRDSKIMEIIEGSNEIQETVIAQNAFEGAFSENTAVMVPS
jgi:glutaryl-CoA dehydrogenase (non-decarboxylating)